MQCPAGAGARQAGGGPRVPRGVARLEVGLSRVYTRYIPKAARSPRAIRTADLWAWEQSSA